MCTCARCGEKWYESHASDSFWYQPRYRSGFGTSEEYPLMGGGCAACAVDAMTEEHLHRYLSDPCRQEPFVNWLLAAPAVDGMPARVYELFRRHDHDLWLDAARDYAQLHSGEALAYLRTAG